MNFRVVRICSNPDPIVALWRQLPNRSPSPYLYQFWLISTEVLWRSAAGNFAENGQNIRPWYAIFKFRIQPPLPGSNESIPIRGWLIGTRVSIHYANGRLTARSRELSKLRDSDLDFQSLWNLTGTSAASPPWCLSNCTAIDHYYIQSRDFVTFGGKTSYR